MRRPLARLPLRSIRPRIGDARLYHSHTRAGSTGHNVLWNRAVSNVMLFQRRIVDALRLGKRGEATNLLVSLSQGNDLRGADDFVHVLKYCARLPNPLIS